MVYVKTERKTCSSQKSLKSQIRNTGSLHALEVLVYSGFQIKDSFIGSSMECCVFSRYLLCKKEESLYLVNFLVQILP